VAGDWHPPVPAQRDRRWRIRRLARPHPSSDAVPPGRRRWGARPSAVSRRVPGVGPVFVRSADSSRRCSHLLLVEPSHSEVRIARQHVDTRERSQLTDPPATAPTPAPTRAREREP
jgi:hypothetical protein